MQGVNCCSAYGTHVEWRQSHTGQAPAAYEADLCGIGELHNLPSYLALPTQLHAPQPSTPPLQRVENDSDPNSGLSQHGFKTLTALRWLAIVGSGNVNRLRIPWTRQMFSLQRPQGYRPGAKICGAPSIHTDDPFSDHYPTHQCVQLNNIQETRNEIRPV